MKEVALGCGGVLNDVYRVFPYIVYGQLFALLTSLKVGNRPDTPSPTGTVNRVVQGVIIHEFENKELFMSKLTFKPQINLLACKNSQTKMVLSQLLLLTNVVL